MELNNDLIQAFAKSVTQKEEEQEEKKLHNATAYIRDNRVFVRIDGSQNDTPAISTVGVSDGERVTVELKDHKAYITGTGDSAIQEVSRVVDREVINPDGTITIEQVIQKVLSTRMPAQMSIDEITSKLIATEVLNADLIETEKIKADSGFFKKVTTTILKADSIEAAFADFGVVRTEDLEAGSALIKDLQAKIVTTDVLESAVVNTNIITTNNLSAKLIDSEVVDADTVNAMLVNTKAVTTDQLEAGSALITDLTAKIVTTDSVSAITAGLGYLQADSAVITELTGDTANIKSILAGNVGTGSLTTITLTSENSTLATSFVENLLANYITAEAIFGNSISTNKFKVISDDGRLEIYKNTITIKDDSDIVRIQIGRDSSGGFSFAILDEEGTGTIIDQNGIKERAISDGLIKSDKIASKTDDYEGIDSTKLNINSITRTLNDEGNLEVSAAKVYYDDEHNSIKTVIQSMESKLVYDIVITSSNGTVITDKTVLTANIYDYGTTDVATGSFTYQWYKNGSVITDATSKSLEIALTEDEDVAQYSCKVSY